MANFIKNFKKQNYEEGFLPNEVLEELNSKWEGKFKYIYDKNNSYILTPTSEKINFKIENFEIVDIDLIKKKCNKDSLSMEDIFNYSYNAQKPIFLKPKKNFKQYINNIEIDNKERVISKNGDVELQPDKMVLYPSKMDNHFKLNIGNGEKSYEYDFMQKPIEDLTKKYYVSSSSNISIEYIVDGNDIKFNMMLNHKNMKNAQEYLDTLIFMKSLFDKGLFINSKLITKPGLKDDRYNNRCELISIWKKITDLEKRLGLEFPLDTDVIDKEEYLNICILHKALIENKAVRRNQLIKNFTYNLNELTEDEQKDLKEKKGKNYCMEFSNQVEITIFKQKISLFELKCYFNLYIKDVECNKNKQEILVLLEEKEDSKMFNSTLLFTSEEELSNFRNTDNHIDLLFNSEELFEKKSSICDI